ncbi:hypothetical protein [Paraburkholderia panacisoli]|uniref:hypothetical protein n=1 Tax=Paraburkholderia panacisoli TaxID=2603818 RepID=UPI00165F17A7|nr:hypothetical protein [Paraburkholderia panacisoli]
MVVLRVVMEAVGGGCGASQAVASKGSSAAQVIKVGRFMVCGFGWLGQLRAVTGIAGCGQPEASSEQYYAIFHRPSRPLAAQPHIAKLTA